MKVLKRVLPFIVALTLFFQQLVCTSFVSYAIDSQFIVQKHYAVFGQSPFDFLGTGAYYTINNPNGLTPCSASNPNYLYTSNNETFEVCTGMDMLVNVANLGLGILLSEYSLNNLKGYFNSLAGSWNSCVVNGEVYFQDGLYDSNHNFYGYVLNDISGCYYSFSNLDNNIQVPSNQVNNVYNYITSDPDVYGSIIMSPYYIDIECPTFSEFKNGYVSDVFSDSFDSIFSTYNKPFVTGVYRTESSNNSHFIVGGTFACSETSETPVLLADNSPSFNALFDDFCWYFNLNGLNNSIKWTDIVNFKNYAHYNDVDSSDINKFASFGYNFGYVNGSNTSPLLTNRIFSFYNNGSYSSEVRYNYNLGDLRLGYSNIVDVGGVNYERFLFPVLPDDNKTIRVIGLSTSQHDSNSFNSNSFNNFDSGNNNSYNTTSQNVDNSLTYNTNSYNAVNSVVSNSTHSNPISYSVINNSVINNITNNYGSAPNNSDIVDDNGGSGGSGGSGGDNSDSVLDKFLALLLKLFEAVGKIFSTILTGIISLFTMIIDTLSELMSDITPFTQFLGTLFGFLPAPVPQVLATGFSICILCAVISFIRGK